MAIKEDLIAIVGARYLFDDEKRLTPYSRDYSLSAPGMPDYVVQPSNSAEVQKIVRLANKYRMPVVPCSSGIHFYGTTIPGQGGIVIDLKRMNRILGIDERNRMARIEPGVTWEQLQPELRKHDLMAISPLLPHPLKSAVTSHLEREPGLIPRFEYTDTLVNVEMVLPDGELIRSGSTCVTDFPDKSVADGVNPSGPSAVMWPRLVQGAQGTLGIITWAMVKVEYRPKVNKTWFIPLESLAKSIELVYKVQRREIGAECFILNNVNLAAILADKWLEDFNALREQLPTWTVILVLDGGKRFPEDKIAYQEDALNQVVDGLAIPTLRTSLPGAPGWERDLPDMLRTAWPKQRTYWKFAGKGSCQDLFFHTTLNKAPAFTDALIEVAARHDYPAGEIGFYIQPLVYGGACHFEGNFAYNPANNEEIARLKGLIAEAAEVTLSMGGFFTRPYGLINDMVYSQAASYTPLLKKVKKMLDPNNVLSPGRLCF